MTSCTDTELLAELQAVLQGPAADLLCQKLSASAPLEELNRLEAALNTQFLLWTGALVFIMHGGFAMLCAGAIRSKNAMNILLQTVMDATGSAIAFYLVGYGLAYGATDFSHPFAGDKYFALSKWPGHAGDTGADLFGSWQMWFFQWAFAATATTIPAGCVAERFNFYAYMAYSIWIPIFVYPIVAHWVWGNGWLSPFYEKPLFNSGFIDFAGCSVVHAVGGFTGLVACILVGPRIGRFDSDGKPVDMPGHSATLVVLGTVLLWFGWYGFNPGSVLLISSRAMTETAARCACTTTLSGAAGALTLLFITFFKTKTWDLVQMCNGALVGFVSITSGTSVLEPWAAIIAGFVGAFIFDFVSAMLLKFRIDDPLGASPMHGFCGIWGVIVTGLLAKKEYVIQVFGDGVDSPFDPTGGLFYGHGRLFGAQVIGVIVIVAWIIALTFPLFFVLKIMGVLRISAEDEHAGLDASKHGGAAYNVESATTGAKATTMV